MVLVPSYFPPALFNANLVLQPMIHGWSDDMRAIRRVAMAAIPQT